MAKKDIPSESLLDDGNTALLSVPTENITETNWLIYAAVSAILEMLGYETNNGKEHGPSPWTRRLEAKVSATQREISLLTKQSRRVKFRRELPKKYNKMSIDEALETAKQ